MRFTALLIVIAFAAAACSSTNPVLERKVLEWHAKSGSQMFDGKGMFKRPMPLAVGQYTVCRMIDGDDRSVLRSAVVGKEGDGWIFESHSITPSGESVTQMLLKGVEQTWETWDPDRIDIVWVRVKTGDEEPQKIEGPALSIMKGTYKKMLNGMYLKFNQDEGVAAVKVPAGTFNDCTKATAELEILFWSDTVEAYYHPSVPLNGLVRSVSKDDGSVMELVEFGTSGAKPSF